MGKIAFVPALLAVWLSSAAAAGDGLEELDKRILQCDAVLKSVLQMPDRTIPKELLQRCRGLAIFPGVFKAGLVVGISYGKGVVLRREERTGQWSRPAFFGIRGGSLGAQVGVQYVDLILLVMSDKGMEGLLEDKFTLGADASVAAGPVGRDAAAETILNLDAGILSYSQTKGLFAGIALTGGALEPDRKENEAYHGKGVSVQDVFYEGKGSLSDSARSLMRTLDKAVGNPVQGGWLDLAYFHTHDSWLDID